MGNAKQLCDLEGKGEGVKLGERGRRASLVQGIESGFIASPPRVTSNFLNWDLVWEGRPHACSHEGWGGGVGEYGFVHRSVAKFVS